MRARLALLLALVASGASAQVFRVPPVRTVATLGVATTVKIVAVTDGLTAADCATGGGSAVALCLATGSAWIAIPTSASSGTVSSLAIAVPSEWSVSGSPVTTSGTITIAEATQTVNTVYAGPTTGSAAAPGFRSLVSADIPNNAANTSGLAGTATALAANGANCSAGSYPLGVDASGAAESCTVVAADPTLAGDVDGLSSANDLDEVSVEAELEAVLDLQDLQGAVTDGQVPNGITVDLATTATTANAGDSALDFFPSGTLNTARLGSGSATNGTYLRGDQTWAAISSVGGSTGSTDDVVLCSDGTGGATVQACNAPSVFDAPLTINVDNATDGGALTLQRKDLTSSALILQARQIGTSLPTITSLSGRLQLQAANGNEWIYINTPGLELRYPATNKTVWLRATETGVLQVQGDAAGSTGGGVRPLPTDSPPTCADGLRGTIYFDDSLGEHCGCKGATGAASWQQLDGGGAC